jgi:hypothetical protein
MYGLGIMLDIARPKVQLTIQIVVSILNLFVFQREEPDVNCPMCQIHKVITRSILKVCQDRQKGTLFVGNKVNLEVEIGNKYYT